MNIIFTGDGKGKTTAAIGQAMRAVGNGSKVLMVQFIKGPWKSGEDKAAKELGDRFKIAKKGKGFVRISGDKLPFETHVKAAKDGLAYALREARSGEWDIIILDELWNAHYLGLISGPEICSFIEEAKPHIDHLIMTGRSCPPEFVERADLVTEMREVKHPFASGVVGAKGVEF